MQSILCKSQKVWTAVRPQRLYSNPARPFTSIKRPNPFILTDMHSKQTEVTMKQNPTPGIPLGSFATDLKAQLSPGFLLEPNPRDEPEILISKPDLFKENPEFWKNASQVLKETIHLDPTYSDLVAAETKTQYFHIYDFRLPPLFGRIPEVEDILGTVELDLSSDVTKIVPGSFEPNSMYRPVTQYGAMLVSPTMFRILAQRLSSSK